MANVVKARHVNRMIRRYAEVSDLPERQLWRDVICRAVADLTDKDVSNEDRHSAKQFFTDIGFELVCDAAGIDFEFCAGLVGKLGQRIGQYGAELQDSGGRHA